MILDETWVNVGHAANRVWCDVRVKTPRDASYQAYDLTHPEGTTFCDFACGIAMWFC